MPNKVKKKPDDGYLDIYPCNYVTFYRNRGADALRERLRRDPDINANVFYHFPPGFLLALPLFMPIEKSCMEAAKIMVEAGANPFLKCLKRHITPCCYAIEQGELEMAQYFVSQKANHPEWEGMESRQLN